MRDERKSRPTLPLRLLLAGGVVLASAALLLALLVATDTALSILDRLRQTPGWLVAAVAALFALLLAFSAWLVWRLLRAPRRPPAAERAAPTREAIATRAAALQARGAGGDALQELDALDQRRASGTVHVALFGSISTGKSTLAAALSGREDIATDVRGGTTRELSQWQGRLPDGRELVLADAPGLEEVDGEIRAAMARAEAVRAHAVVYVADGDLTRAQHAELAALLALGKPTVLALNKSDRYRDDELAALRAKLAQRYAGQALVVATSAGGVELLQRHEADGREVTLERPRAPRLAALLQALAELTAEGAAGLEPARQRAVLETLAQQLAHEEARLRERDAEAVVRRYTRRAVIGALAAVAPGTDLVIQGALGTAMLRELAHLHGVGLRDVDLDRFVQRAGSTLRTTTSITLAIAGNALKAFPGLGTLGGGLLHAIAYGLVFDALGHAAAKSLGERATLDPEAAAQSLAAELADTRPERLARVAASVGEALTGRGRAPD